MKIQRRRNPNLMIPPKKSSNTNPQKYSTSVPKGRNLFARSTRQITVAMSEARKPAEKRFTTIGLATFFKKPALEILTRTHKVKIEPIVAPITS